MSGCQGGPDVSLYFGKASSATLYRQRHSLRCCALSLALPSSFSFLPPASLLRFSSLTAARSLHWRALPHAGSCAIHPVACQRVVLPSATCDGDVHPWAISLFFSRSLLLSRPDFSFPPLFLRLLSLRVQRSRSSTASRPRRASFPCDLSPCAPPRPLSVAASPVPLHCLSVRPSRSPYLLPVSFFVPPLCPLLTPDFLPSYSRHSNSSNHPQIHRHIRTPSIRRPP